MESKYRIVHTRFWSDNFIANLNSLDRYLFLYFLTNEHTNIAGIYELPIRTMEFETGLQQEQLLIILERLKEKIVYYEGWIFIKNFSKYQSSGEKIDKAIENIKSKIPENIIHHLYSMDTPSIHHHIVKESKVKESKVNISVSDKPKQTLKKDINEPMTLQEFYTYAKSCPQKHIQIIGEWADTTKPSFTTYGQWQKFIKRNLRPAKDLEPYTDEQLKEAFAKIETAKKEGWLKKYTLETLGKFL